jgi:hypothetical protein
MSIFGSIMSKIFGAASSAATSVGSAVSSAAGSITGSAQAAPMPAVDVAAVMDGLAAKSKERLDWKKSIVDLMKLLGLDSSLKARQELAKELSYTGDMNDSATMNIWLHKQVMQKLAANGGKVPDDLKH